MNIIEVDKLIKSYGKQTVLKDISLNVPSKSIFGLLGPNGAGKTTFIRILNQIINYDSGTILFKNEPLGRKNISSFGYLPEERGLYAKMKVGEHLLYLAELKGMPKQKARKVLLDYLREFELFNMWDRKVEQLSKGMQQKLQFIIAVMHEPELIILDEPFTGFDPINVEIVKQKILQLNQNGTTFILSTHRMETVEELSDYIVLINKAEKVLEGEVRSIRSTYKKNMFSIEYLPVESEMNIQSGLFDVIENDSSKVNELHKLSIKVRNDIEINQVLKELMGYMEIRSVNEIIPTINEIFISLVKEN